MLFQQAVEFKYPWRSYQARVLDDLEMHLSDSKLHVIAPPGSGKTILGLEVMLRLGKPTLILAPTIAIRNQWIDRFLSHFCTRDQADLLREHLSTDLRAPKLMTAVTYQMLYAAASETNSDDPDESEVPAPFTGVSALISSLSNINLGVLIADECHHLRNEWWRALDAVTAAFPKLTTVSLTATPPLDVTPAEWNRYSLFCGPSDAEISAAELVKAGDLCPHQDLIRVTVPTADEQAELEAIRTETDNFISSVFAGTKLEKAVLSHPWIINPKAERAAILADPALYSAMLSYLAAKSFVPAPDHLLPGTEQLPIPSFNRRMQSILFDGISQTDLPAFEECRKAFAPFRAGLSDLGSEENGIFFLNGGKRVYSALSQSRSKLRAIEEITVREASLLGFSLRLLILTDYIRKEYKTDTEKSALGAVPLFDMIRAIDQPGITPAVLCGSIVIIPQNITSSFSSAAFENCIDPDLFRFTPYEDDPSFAIVTAAGNTMQHAVHLVTSLFEQGLVTVLIGTKSYLGEGWDSPAINTLILASFVGSFVLSNQMRGRAVRSQKRNPEKVSNIWHVVCSDFSSEEGGADWSMLKRRFSAFSGISFHDSTVSCGFARMGISSAPVSPEEVEMINSRMMNEAAMRRSVGYRWIPPKEKVPPLKALVRFLKKIFTEEPVNPQDAAAAEIGKIGTMLYRTLDEMRKIHLYGGKVSVQFTELGLRIRLLNASPEESMRFSGSLLEMVGPIENPWFLLKRTMQNSELRQISYLPIPKTIQTVGTALRFAKIWKTCDDAEVVPVDCRTDSGRLELLAARRQKPLAGFPENYRPLSEWE